MKILLAIIIFGFLILIHELGHYTAARLFHVAIREFAIGMGPKVLSKKSGKTGIVYSLRLLPIGGFVSMDGEEEDSETENSLRRKPLWQRFIIMAAGAFMNILVGVILTCVIVCTGINGNTTVAGFTENAASESAGLREGDRILKIGSQNVHTYYDLNYTVYHDAVTPKDITVLRDGKRVTVSDVTFGTVSYEGITVAEMDFLVFREEKTFGSIVRQSFWQSVTTVRMIWESLFDLVTGRYGMEAVSGPVGTTTAIGEAAEAGTQSLLYITALIALNLGVFNLLPFPALDGGQILFLLIELIRRKPMKREVEGYVNFTGLALLMLLMLAVTMKDIFQLFG